jgi:hypothetical protein
MTTDVTAYPLSWPLGRERTARSDRKAADFGKRDSNTSGGYRFLRRLSVAQALDRIHCEISAYTRAGRSWRIDPAGVVVSTNVRTRRDGLPYSGEREPDDPGVAVYFQLDGEDYCLACDRWTRVADNMAAIAAHLGALRGIERWGVGDLRQAFAGYTALPAPEGARWHDVLGVAPDARRVEIDAAYRRRRSETHPDRGGSADEFDAVQRAYEQSRIQL